MGLHGQPHPSQMSKLDKLLLILNLLYHRPHVSLESIQRECQISERTAYRYVRSLSSARFPVYFDEEVKGYRLVERGSPLSHLTADEAAMVLFGLVMLEKSLGPSRLDAVRRARAKLEMKLTANMQEVILAGKPLLYDRHTPEVIKEHLVMSLIKLANTEECGVKLQYTGENTQGKNIIFDKPRLIFDNEWMIGPKRDSLPESRIPIRLVRDLSLLNT